RWFKSNAKIKRWLFILLLGIVLVCYGIANIIEYKTLGKLDIVKIVASFVAGFVLIVLSVVHAQKRMLELLVEESDTRSKKNNVKSLIFNKRIYNQGPKIVVIGGGRGLNTVLTGLKNYTDNIIAIVTVSDYGETPTDSRKALEVLPLNDLKDSIASLAYNEEEMKDLMYCKFHDGKMKGLSFGDIYFLAMNRIHGDFSKSVESSTKILNMTGKV
ncbi:2-phospho-L-lactate transferase CofD family protein, partial [Ralstonia pseudosolanacearum]|uniref:2-phospho-L-lactate transferase CofD family protein n=1 Tax=Ralstonia pseudosolanacearum TaxID=1310165 RepID=UPI003CEF1282